MSFKHFIFVFGSLWSQRRAQKSPQGSELLGDLRLTQIFPWLQREQKSLRQAVASINCPCSLCSTMAVVRQPERTQLYEKVPESEHQKYFRQFSGPSLAFYASVSFCDDTNIHTSLFKILQSDVLWKHFRLLLFPGLSLSHILAALIPSNRNRSACSRLGQSSQLVVPYTFINSAPFFQ